MNDVGAMPTPHVEEPERFPGGPDALADQSRYGEIPEGPVGVDLPPDVTPSSVAVPDPVTEPDDKPQEPTEASAEDHEDEDEEPETPV